MNKSELTLKDFLRLTPQEQGIIFTEIAIRARIAFNEGYSPSVCMARAKKETGYLKTVVNFCVRSDNAFIEAANKRGKAKTKFFSSSMIKLGSEECHS